MYELDCLGDMCPIPIMKLKQCKQIKALENGDSRADERNLGAVHRKPVKPVSRYFY